MSLYKLDEIDRKIIKYLQKDAKMKIKEVASKLAMTSTPIFERIKRLEKNGIIKGYSTLVDEKKLGYSLTAFCSITLEKHNKEFIEQFETEVKLLTEVTECYHLAGGFDYLLKLHVKDMMQYQSFLKDRLATLANISRVESSFVMSELKNEKVLPYFT